MLKIVIGSAFRNAVRHIPRYMAQVRDLQEQSSVYPSACSIRVVAVEGDSTDRTDKLLHDKAQQLNISIDVITHNHGQPWFGSVEHPTRMKSLSGVCNAILDGVDPTDDVLVYVESDLIWDFLTIRGLIHSLLNSNFDIISPMVWAGDSFYDTWGFRKDGIRFSAAPPYHSNLLPVGLTEVDSVGSCLVMRASVVTDNPKPRSKNGALVEWCSEARKAGYRIAVDRGLGISHP